MADYSGLMTGMAGGWPVAGFDARADIRGDVRSGVRPDIRPDIRGAIARAAGRTGVDFSYLMAQARIESGLDPKARSATSSASGLFQFTNGTWRNTLARHQDLLGVGLGANLGTASPAALMALRENPEASALMASGLAADNRLALSATLGRAPDAAELYLAHFLGSEGAGRFLGALAQDGSQSAAQLLPKAAGANRAIFYDGQGGARTLAQVMGLIRGKMDAALEAERDAESGADGGFDPLDYATMAAVSADAGTGFGGPLNGQVNGPFGAAFGGPLAQEFAAAQADTGQAAAGTRSMADTLASAFGGLGVGGAAPAAVVSAYRSFAALGL